MKYTQNKSFFIKEIAGEKVLVPRGNEAIEFGGMIAFNDTGIIIWEAIETPKTSSEIVKIITENFNVTFEDISDDIATYLSRAVKAGFILETEK